MADDTNHTEKNGELLLAKEILFAHKIIDMSVELDDIRQALNAKKVLDDAKDYIYGRGGYLPLNIGVGSEYEIEMLVAYYNGMISGLPNTTIGGEEKREIQKIRHCLQALMRVVR